MSLITLGLATDYLTEAGSDPTAPITSSNRPFFWQQIERTRANFANTLDNLANIKHRRVSLTDAQVKALPTTMIELVPAPAAGLTNFPIAYFLELTRSANYTNINANGWMGVYFGAGPDAAGFLGNDSSLSPNVLTSLTDFLASGAARVRYNLPNAYYDDRAAVAGVNGWGLIADVMTGTGHVATPLNLYADNVGSGNFTGGNAANVLRVDVLYIVL